MSAEPARVWAALTDPALLPRLTPLLRSIEAEGDVWRWQMMRISALGVTISPTFTEKMSFDEPNTIEYTHAPPSGVVERTGAEGRYELREIDGGTELTIALQLDVDLPLPRAARLAVERVMTSTMRRTGDRFAANLLQHLGAREL